MMGLARSPKSPIGGWKKAERAAVLSLPPPLSLPLSFSLSLSLDDGARSQAPAGGVV